MSWTEFAALCIEAYRPHGMFAGAVFESPANMRRALETRLDIRGDEAFYDENPAVVYAALWSLSPADAAVVDLKKAGAEDGEGYYRAMAERLVACCASRWEVLESAPEEGIVAVDVAAELKAPWGTGPVAVRQSFAPLSAFTDLIFVEQLLKALLGDALSGVRSREGLTTEEALYIFPPSPAAARAIEAFEARHLPGDEARSETLDPGSIPDLPQPTCANIDEISARFGIRTAPAAPRAAPAAPPQAARPGVGERVMLWVERLLRAVVGLAVARILLALFGDAAPL